jgi:hypothetical protein
VPRLKTDFPSAEPVMIGNYSIDFNNNIPPNVTIKTATWTLGLHSTASGKEVDPNPSSHLLYTDQNAGPIVYNTIVVQQIGGLIDGNTYLVTVTASLSDGEVIDLWCYLPCAAPQ